MNFTIINKLKPLLIIMLLITLLLTACSQPEKIASTQKSESISTSAETLNNESIGQSVSRTDDVFNNTKYEGLLKVRFFSIDASEKSGDSILLETPEGITMLIDSGLEACGTQIAGYLKKLGIKKLDYILASHLHVDHIGGFPTVMNAFEVNKVLTVDFPYNTNPNKKFQQTIETKKINKEFLKVGDSFQLGKDVKIEILNPEPTITIPSNIVPENTASFVNDRSIVMKVTYKQRTFLFPGDIYATREKQLVENMKEKLDVDVLKAPHHGDNTSSSPQFIEAVTPKYTIITTNILQSKTVYDKYVKSGSNTYITGADGTVLLTCDGDKINVITEKDRNEDFFNN